MFCLVLGAMDGRFIKVDLCIIICFGSSVCGDYSGHHIMETSSTADWVAKTHTQCAWPSFILAPIYSCSYIGHCIFLPPQWSLFSHTIYIHIYIYIYIYIYVCMYACMYVSLLSNCNLNIIIIFFHLQFCPSIAATARMNSNTMGAVGCWTACFPVHPIANELELSTEPSDMKMRKVVRECLMLCTSIYFFTGLFAYLLFGEATSDDVLANFDANLGIPFSHTLTLLVRASYAIHIMLVFPLLHFSLRLNVDGLLYPKAAALVHDNLRFALITGFLVFLIFFGSTLVPNIWVAFEYTGATVGVCLAFIFPGLIMLKWVQPFCYSMYYDLILFFSVFFLLITRLKLYHNTGTCWFLVFLGGGFSETSQGWQL